jgi:hypothetical protein
MAAEVPVTGPDIADEKTDVGEALKARIAEACRIVAEGRTPRDYTRFYVGPYSRIAHLVPNTLNIYGYGHTVCGRAIDRWWLGTGSHIEYEHAASLPTCARCKTDYPMQFRGVA